MTQIREQRTAWMILCLLCGFVFLFLIAPSLVVIAMSFGSSPFLTFPPEGFSLQWFDRYFADERWLAATWRSLRIAGVVTLAATVIGTMAALASAGLRGWLRKALNVLLILPMILPVIVYALAVYALYSRLRVVGTDAGLIIAHTVLAVPFVYLTVMAALSRYDASLSQAAASSGANRLQIFWFIMLPIIKPGIIAGALFAFITSFDEVVVANFVSGLDSTLPKKMFDHLRFELTPVLAAIATLLIAVTTTILLIAFRLTWRSAPGQADGRLDETSGLETGTGAAVR